MDNQIKRKAESKLRLGVDPLKVHEWLMQQGCEAEEADRITSCRTFSSAAERERFENQRERERIIDGQYEISDADPGL